MRAVLKQVFDSAGYYESLIQAATALFIREAIANNNNCRVELNESWTKKKKKAIHYYSLPAPGR